MRVEMKESLQIEIKKKFMEGATRCKGGKVNVESIKKKTTTTKGYF